VTLRKVLRSKKWSAGGERALGDEKWLGKRGESENEGGARGECKIWG
jgi:hypothetical protein